MTYMPTKKDIDWAKDVIALIAHGGLIAYPTSGLIYKIDKDTQTLTLKNSINTAEQLEIHLKTVATFNAIGYGVK